MIEKRIYSAYAGTENWQEKAKCNQEIYQELKAKYKIYRSYYYNGDPSINKDDYDIVLGEQVGYAHHMYRILKAPMELTVLELKLICDQGNLCFGGHMAGDTIKIYTD